MSGSCKINPNLNINSNYINFACKAKSERDGTGWKLEHNTPKSAFVSVISGIWPQKTKTKVILPLPSKMFVFPQVEDNARQRRGENQTRTTG